MSDEKVVNGGQVFHAESIDRNGNSASHEVAGVTEVSFESVHRPDPQDNIHTKNQILALLADGAPSWMSGETYPFLAGRTDLLSYKDAVLVAAKNISGLGDEKYAELHSTWSHFGAWDDRNYIALLVWRKKDWQIARELVAKMWNMCDERAIHDYYDCPYSGLALTLRPVDDPDRSSGAWYCDPNTRCHHLYGWRTPDGAEEWGKIATNLHKQARTCLEDRTWRGVEFFRLSNVDRF